MFSSSTIPTYLFLNHYSTVSLSRSVVTVAGQLPALEEAVLAAAKVSFKELHSDFDVQISKFCLC